MAASPAPANQSNVFEARGLVKRFGELEALRGVSFEAHPGEMLGVIGPNGAGKTTLLSILAGVLKPDAGEMNRARGEIGWVPQTAALYRRLTVSENLSLFARLERVERPAEAVDEMLELAGLEDRRNDQVGSLSAGNQQRVNIAIGLLTRPRALLLDEPSAALDPRQRERLWRFVGDFAEAGTTVVFSTHNLAEAARHGDRVLVLADGEGLFDGSPGELRAAVESEPENGAARGDFESAFVAFLRHRGH